MITLDKETHKYTDEKGRICPSVTQILSDVGIIDKTWFDEYSANRGTQVHLACEMYDNGVLDESSLDERIKPYLEGWKKFIKESGFEIHMVEQLVHQTSMRYCGTLDRRGLWNGKKALIDIKTGSVLPWVALQTAAYDFCLNERHKRFGVQLTDDGRYKVFPFDDRYDSEVFLSALALHNWKENKGIK